MERFTGISEPAGLYIHVPFCLQKCSYCSFYSRKLELGLLEQWFHALIVETDIALPPGIRLTSVYAGGGTPGLVSPAMWRAFWTKLRERTDLSGMQEATIETNPAANSEEGFRGFIDAGWNRIGIGIQSFNDGELDILGRIHTSAEAETAYHRARSAGFDSVSLDLIYGIPTQTIESWRNSLEKIISLRPEHISAYELTLGNDTPLSSLCETGDLTKPDEDTCVEMYMMANELLTDAGYVHYEVSSYSLGEGNRSIHNSSYWNHNSYVGLGPSAHGFDGNRTRWWNLPDVQCYIDQLGEGNSPIESREHLTPEQLVLENVMLAMRTAEGLDLDSLRLDYGAILSEKGNSLVEKLYKKGRINRKGSRLMPTAEGMLLADGIALDLFENVTIHH